MALHITQPVDMDGLMMHVNMFGGIERMLQMKLQNMNVNPILETSVSLPIWLPGDMGG
jgi:hypothetical protein